jgi:hypothetical protein
MAWTVAAGTCLLMATWAWNAARFIYLRLAEISQVIQLAGVISPQTPPPANVASRGDPLAVTCALLNALDFAFNLAP